MLKIIDWKKIYVSLIPISELFFMSTKYCLLNYDITWQILFAYAGYKFLYDKTWNIDHLNHYQ